MLDDASPPAGIAQSWRGDLCITAARWLAFPSGKAPSRTGAGWSGPLAYNAYVARGSVAGGADLLRVCDNRGWSPSS
jgi:hypothetical protein